MIRVFLDANILFSAAWREGGGINALWERPDLQLVTSPHALQEATRNIEIKRPSATQRLIDLATSVEVSPASGPLDDSYGLPAKDEPILASAIGTGCSVLLTGDIAHFGHLIETEVQGMQVLTPAMFLASLPKAE